MLRGGVFRNRGSGRRPPGFGFSSAWPFCRSLPSVRAAPRAEPERMRSPAALRLGRSFPAGYCSSARRRRCRSGRLSGTAGYSSWRPICGAGRCALLIGRPLARRMSVYGGSIVVRTGFDKVPLRFRSVAVRRQPSAAPASTDEAPLRRRERRFAPYPEIAYLLSLAQESLSVTVRLNTGCSGVESVSGQK